MIGPKQNLSNKIFGKNRRRCLTVGQIQDAFLGVPRETMVAIATGEQVGSIFEIGVDQFRPERHFVNPNKPEQGEFWEFKPTPLCWEGTDVVVLVASTLFEKEKEAEANRVAALSDVQRIHEFLEKMANAAKESPVIESDEMKAVFKVFDEGVADLIQELYLKLEEFAGK